MANDSLMNKLLNSTPAKVKGNDNEFPFEEYNDPIADVLCDDQMSKRKLIDENGIKCNTRDDNRPDHLPEPSAHYDNPIVKAINSPQSNSISDGLSVDGDLSSSCSVNSVMHSHVVAKAGDYKLIKDKTKSVDDNDLESPVGSVVSVDSGYNDEVTCSIAVSCHASTTTTTNSYAQHVADPGVNINCSSSEQVNDRVSDTFTEDSSTDYQESSYNSRMKLGKYYSVLELNLNSSIKNLSHENSAKPNKVLPSAQQRIPISNNFKSGNSKNTKYNKSMAAVKTKIERPSNYVKSNETEPHQSRKTLKPVGRPPKRHYSPRAKGEKRYRKSAEDDVKDEPEAQVDPNAPVRPGLAALLPPIQTFRRCVDAFRIWNIFC